ncbi:MAG TPA: potassium-transporting ATPase subunit KdpC [Pirellulaceae bacterium]|nr:potassium-transporting ATPase subunit KdpC [Pirellulaceae bacterium]
MSDLFSSLRLFAVSLFVCSVIYPALILSFAVVAAPETRNGSLLRDEQGTIIGSRLLAQDFSQDKYFWPRPSAVDYDASATGGSNYSPTNPELTKVAAEIVGRLRLADGKLVPADLVSMSGSGLDPHITLTAALVQVDRIAQARNLSSETVEALIRSRNDSPSLVKFGAEPLVNVLELNIALDRMAQ